MQVSTLVITLNHGCCRCFTKIRKAVCKLQETEDIRVVSSDEVSGTVTVSGGFDPLVLPCKLRRKAGSLIRDIRLVAAERLILQRPVQRPALMLPNPPGGLGVALAPSCCCGISGCGGYGDCYCGCQACAFINHTPDYCYHGGIPFGLQHPKITCEAATARRRRLLRARSCDVFTSI